MIAIWTRGILATRWRHLAISAAGIVAATALVGVIGAFGVASGRTMTARALSAVPVDWQVALVAGADASSLLDRLSQSAPIRAARVVGYADSTSFTFAQDGTTQTTAAGAIVALPAAYAAILPCQIRVL